jgi:hypothetical protein
MPVMMLCCPVDGEQDFQSASLGVGFQKGGLRPAPQARSLGRSCIPFKAVDPGAASSASHATLPIPAVTRARYARLMLSSVAPPVSSRPFAYKQLACGSPQTKKSICLLDNLGIRCSP